MVIPLSSELTSCSGKDLWKKTDESPLYNYTLLRQHLSNFEKLSQEGNIPAVALALRSCMRATRRIALIDRF